MLAIGTEEVISGPVRGRIPDLLDSMLDGSLPHILRSDAGRKTPRRPCSRLRTLEAPASDFVLLPASGPIQDQRNISWKLAARRHLSSDVELSEPC